MGQKINPTGLRIGVIKDWESRWYSDKKDFGDTLVSDTKLRKYLLESLAPAGVPKVEIERDAKRVRVNIHCAKPGMVIGKGGAEIEKLKATCKKMLGGDKEVFVNIIEIKQPDLNAQLVAENIASQLERRISFRRALKQSIGRTMKLGAKGIKTQVSGRIGGAEIARTESYHEGTIPLQTIRADIDFAHVTAQTTYGNIGVKVWICRSLNKEDLAIPNEDAPAMTRGGFRANDRRGARRPERKGGSENAAAKAR